MKRLRKRILSLLLMLAMALSMLPGMVFAAETETYTKITTAEELTTGKYVMVVDTGYAPGVLDGTWVTAVQPAVDGDTVTNDAGGVWTITVDGSNVTMTDANGVSIAPSGGNTNGITSGNYSWAVTCTESGTFQFAGQGDDTVVLASNKSSSNKFRAYKTTTVSGTPASYPSEFTLYKLTAEDEPSDDTAAPLAETIDTGDVVVIYYPTGGKVMSTDSYTYTNSSGTSKKELVAVDGTVADQALTVPEKAAEFEVYQDANGHYTFKNDAGYLYLDGTHVQLVQEQGDYTLFDLEQADGGWYIKSTNATYSGKAQYLEFYGGYFTCFSLNTSNTGIYTFQFYQTGTFTPEETPDIPDPTPETEQYAKLNNTIADGDQFVIYYNKDGLVMTDTVSGKGLAGEAATPQGDFVEVTEAMSVLTASVNEDGQYTFTNAAGKFLTSGATGNSLTFADEASDYSLWTVKAVTGGVHVVSVNASYNGNAQALEIYNGVFTTFTEKDTDYYLFNLYQLTDEKPDESGIDEPEPEPVVPGDITDGDYFIHSATAQGVMRYINAGGAGAVPVTVEDGKVSFMDGVGVGAGVYTLTNLGGGKYTIQLGSQYVGATSSEDLTLNAAKDDSCEWILEKVEGGYTIRNANVKYNSSKDIYLEYYASKGFCLWTMSSLSDIYVFNFYDATGVENTDGYVGDKPVSGNLPTEGTYLVYNPYAASVMGPQGGDDTARNISVVDAELVEEDGETKLDAGNGALIFTIKTYEESGTTYYSFENNGQYLATDENNGSSNAETLFLQENFTEYCKWTLEETEGGYVIYNKEAKYSGSRVCIEYFSGAFSGWTYKGGTNELFAFQFYPATDTYNTGYVVNPKVKFTTDADANLGLDFTVEFTLDDLGTNLSAAAQVAFGSTTKTYPVSLSGKTGSVTVPAADLTGSSMTVTINAASTQGGNDVEASYTGSKTYTIRDLPVIVSVSPQSMASVTSGTVPEIAVEFANAGIDPTITLTLNGQEVTPTVTDGKLTYRAATMADGKYVAAVTIERQDGLKAEKTWTFNVGNVETNLYFGQLHSHTAEYSDGAGTLQDGLNYIASLPASANIQFLAFTDHSNYFDSTTAANPASALYDVTQMTAASAALWNRYQSTVAEFNATQTGLIALAGFEMTWSGGPGHINTFNTPGIVSRNNTELNNKTNNAGLLDYYDLTVETNNLQDGSVVSQFNHPGTTFGFFDSFTGWTAERDEVMVLIEVGNGEGAVGSNGYFPSYEYYDMALSMGWHVAPTNNQDNHKGSWGNSNTCRSVILSDDFTEDGLYEAMAQRRVYSTEDQNLSVVYTLNDVLQGGIIEGFAEDTIKISISLSDSDSSDTIGAVSVIGESGRVLYTFDRVGSNTAELEVELDNTSAYYYIRVVEGDGDIAVTAPVWVDQVAATKTNVTASVTDKGSAVEEQADPLTVTIGNSEESAITVTGYTISVDGTVVETKTVSDSVASGESKSYTYDWTPETYGTHAVKVVFNITANGESKTVAASKNIYVKGKNYDTVVPIAEAKSGSEKEEFTVEGIVTSNASGYDQSTAFFDCIYIQDETGGLNIFPVAGNYQVGQKVRVHGAITYYNGEIELNLSEDYGGMIEVISDAINPPTPAEVSCKDAMASENIGLLMQVSGTITRVHEDSTGVIDRIYVDDGSGTAACLYINGYIKNSQTGGDGFGGAEAKVGNTITAIGIGSVDVDELGEVEYLHRLRVRDRAELVCAKASEPSGPDIPVNPGTPVIPGTPSTPSTPDTPDLPSTPAQPEGNALPFTDVAGDAWYYADVVFVYENGMMEGTSATTFAPDLALTRGMVVTMLYRLEQEPTVSFAGVFADVSAGLWYTNGVEWAAGNGIVTGYPDGSFGPNDPVTREQLAAILYRYATWKGLDVGVGEDTNLLSYTDALAISPYAVEAMQWACGAGLLNGAGGMLMPRDSATRAQVAAIFTRFLSK